MRFWNSLSHLRKQLRCGQQARRPAHVTTRPRLEALEDRTVPSTLNIDAIGDVTYTASAGIANNVTLSEKIIFHKFFQQDVLVLSDTAETINVTGFGAVFCTGSGTNQVTFSSFTLSINAITVDTVDGGDVVNVLADAAPTVVKHSSTLGNLVVNVGNSTNGVQSITAPLTVDGVAFGTTNVNVDNSADPTFHTSGSGVTLGSGSVTGLAPAAINYVEGGFGTLNVTVTLGSGGNSVDLASTPISGLFESGSMTLNTGTGPNQVFVHTTSSPLTIQGKGGADQVFITGDGPGFDLQDIRGSVTVRNTTATTQLTVDDSGDVTAHPAVTMSDSALTGLAPAPIFYQASGLNATKVGFPGLTVGLGLGTDTVTVTNTPPLATLEMGALSQRINVEGLTGKLTVLNFFGAPATVVVGSNSSGTGGTLANINGLLDILQVESSNIIVDDSADNTSRTLKLTADAAGDEFLTGLAPAATVEFQSVIGPNNLTINGGSANNTYDLGDSFLATTVNGGNGNDTFNVSGPGNYTLNTGTGANQVNVTCPAAVNVIGHGGHDTVTVGSLAPALGGTLTNFQPVNVSNTTDTTALIVDDSGDPVARTVILTSDSVQFIGIGSAIHFFSGVKSVDVFGSKGDFYNLQAPYGTTPVTIHGSGGFNTLISGSGVNNWNLTGTNAGSLHNVVFQNIQNLEGGTPSTQDTFHFNNGAAVTGAILGSPTPGSIATLDYSSYTTPVTVNLKLSTATGTGFVSHIEDVLGGQGNNLLVGNGNNILKGGNGRDILISGGGTSTLQAGNGEAVLLGAHYVFDTNVAALNALMAIWSHTFDPSNPLNDYLIRVGQLRTMLNPSTVFAQPGTTTLISGAQLDFLIFDASDIHSPLRPNEQFLFV
jgi:Ca2+-binding RTX toxin-like protein